MCAICGSVGLAAGAAMAPANPNASPTDAALQWSCTWFLLSCFLRTRSAYRTLDGSKAGEVPVGPKKFSSVTVIHLASREPFGTFSHLTHIAVLRERAMANYMIVRQKVIDLAWFQTAFDRLKPNRKAAGLTDLGQFCADDESDVVIVVMNVEDMSRAKELAF